MPVIRTSIQSLRLRPYTTSSTRSCKFCGRVLNAKGHFSHEKACGILHENERRDRLYEERLALTETVRQQGQDIRLDDDEPDIQSDRNSEQIDDESLRNNDVDFSDQLDFSEMGSTQDDSSEPDLHSEATFERDDIKVEYHPNSRLGSVVYHFEDYKRKQQPCNVPIDEEPWKPFICRADFEFASVAMEAALKPQHVNLLIKLIHSIAKGSKFTLTGEKELSRIWQLAADKLTPFRKKTIEVPYKKEVRQYDVWLRPLWDWTVDLLSDRRLAPHFVWNAERLYKYDGTKFERFFDEPWTGNRWWEIQSSLPDKARPFCWIIYADKNKLSSFGTEKGHPVIARCANLPSDIRNSADIGGGRVIGWLPVVKEESAHKKKLSFTNHKRAVWHAAFHEILQSIVSKSKHGCWLRCGDGKKRKVFPCILIMSGDYEEQTFMTLIRGLRGLCPCPTCLISADDLADLTLKAPLRSQIEIKALIRSLKNKTKAEAETLLKPKGLRNIENAFWKVANSDPHEAVSWDRLHAYSIGLFGTHIWSNFKTIIKALGRSAQEKIDNRFDLFPRFRNLHHFSEVMQIYFNDGSKFEDMAKQLIFVAHNVLTPITSPHGFRLLKCLRSFNILDTILAFEVQTEETIQLGEQELENFSALISTYVLTIPPSMASKLTVNWRFIKMHSQQHAFDDIVAKGVTKNFNTKPNEKLHKPLRDAYHLRTNFKDVAGQILKAEHYLLVTSFIKNKIEDLDQHLKGNSEEPNEQVAGAVGGGHYTVGARRKMRRSLYELEESNSEDAAYKDFRKKLANHLNELFMAHSIPLPDNRNIRISAYEQITEYQLLRINYESLITWKENTDILRCNPMFHKRPRFDSILFRAVSGEIFGRLICIVGYEIGGKEYHSALIQACDARTGVPRTIDVELGLKRVKAKPRSSSEFISLHTVIRGAVLVPDFVKEGEFLIMDTLDADMFLRIRNMGL